MARAGCVRRLSISLLLLAGAIAVTATTATVAAETVTLRAWVQANNVEAHRGYNLEAAAEKLNARLEQEGSDLRVQVDVVIDDSGWADYKRRFLFAADSGQAPDIILSGHEDIAPWATAGYIIPLDDRIDAKWDEVYHDIFPNLWLATEWRGQRWGVPQDTEARPMYFNKRKLAELGWSQAEIETLPDRIRTGQFTLDDMIETATEAVERGVVEPGHGYWHRPVSGGDFMQYYLAFGGTMYDAEQDRLVVVRDALVRWYDFQRRVVAEGITPENFIGTEWAIWHDAVSHGNVLFWNGGTWQFADWAANYVDDIGGAGYLYDFVGWALQPSGIPGQPGLTISHPLVYMVTSPQASGRNDQDLAFELITLATDPELNNRHAVGSSHLAILQSQVDMGDYAEDPLLSGAAYMVEYAAYQPNHVDYGPYYDALWRSMQAAESGEFPPDVAADIAIEELQRRMRNTLIVR